MQGNATIFEKLCFIWLTLWIQNLFILGSRQGTEKVQTETVSSELLEESSKHKSVVAGVQVIVSVVNENGLNIFNNIYTKITLAIHSLIIWSACQQIDSILPCVCSVTDHRLHQNVVRTRKWSTRHSRVCHSTAVA